MQRSWIIGVSVAFVIGTAGASYAAIATHDPAAPATALAQAPVVTSSNSATYRIGDAGVVTVTKGDGALTITSSAPSDGWTLVGVSDPAAHVEVQLSDGSQIVTFAADLVDDKIVVSVSSEATVTTDSSPASSVPMEVTQMSDPAAGSTPVTTPVARPRTTQPWVPTNTATTTVHTTSPHTTQHPTTVPHTTTTHTTPRTTVPHTTVPRTTEPHTTEPHTTIPPTTPTTHPPRTTEPSDD